MAANAPSSPPRGVIATSLLLLTVFSTATVHAQDPPMPWLQFKVEWNQIGEPTPPFYNPNYGWVNNLGDFLMLRVTWTAWRDYWSNDGDFYWIDVVHTPLRGGYYTDGTSVNTVTWSSPGAHPDNTTYSVCVQRGGYVFPSGTLFNLSLTVYADGNTATPAYTSQKIVDASQLGMAFYENLPYDITPSCNQGMLEYMGTYDYHMVYGDEGWGGWTDYPPPPPPTPVCTSMAGVSVLGPAGMAPWGNASLAPGLFPDPTAQWIWSAPGAADSATTAAPPLTPPLPTFFKSITVPAATDAWLHIMVDAAAEIFLNGGRVGAVRSGWQGRAGIDAYGAGGRPLRLQLSEGANTLALRCSSTKGSSGVLAAVVGSDNVTVLARTDASWSYFNNPAAAVLGKASMAPYGNTNIRPNRFPDASAKWITSPFPEWTPNPLDPSSSAPSATFIQHLNLLVPRPAILHVIADGVAEVYVNGALITTVTDGWQEGQYAGAVPVDFPVGANVIAVTVRRAEGRSSAGLLLSLFAVKNRGFILHSDASWAVADDSCNWVAIYQPPSSP